MSQYISQKEKGKKFYKKFNKEFKEFVWRRLTNYDREELCARFMLIKEKPTFKDVLKHFETKVPPRSFCIAAVARLETPNEKAYKLIDKNPVVELFKNLIVYDLDKWGARRLENEKYIGILDQNKNPLSDEKKIHFEYLLRCSLSLSFPEKQRIFIEAPGLSMFQIDSLIKVFEEELDKWYTSDSRVQKADLQNLVTKREKEWEKLVEIGIKYHDIELDKFYHPTPKAIVKMVKKYVKGQDSAVESLANAFYYQHKIARKSTKLYNTDLLGRIEPLLLVGPTGSGKSFLVKKMAETIDLPFVSVDASSMVSVGIKGYNTNDALKDLIRKSNYRVEEAQNGIIYFDEIDKLLVHHDGRSILSQLLRIIEGSTIFIEKNNHSEEREFETIKSIDTTHIFFILGGSFEMQNRASSGFIKQKRHFASRYDFEDAGIPKELIGRIEDVIVLNKLSRDDLRDILLHSKESPLKKYQKLLSLNDKELVLEDDTLNKIIDEAAESPYGARTLNALLKNYLKEQLFEAPSVNELI